MTTITYGDDFSVPVASIPEAVQHLLLQQAFNHRMGNQADAQVTTRIRAAEGDEVDVAAWRKANPDRVAAMLREVRQATVDRILSGELTQRASGPRLDPVEKEFASLVRASLKSKLESHGFKMPKKLEDSIVFPDGSRTLAEMLQKTAEGPDAPKLRERAERIVRDRERAVKAAAPAGAEASAAALGF